MDTSALKETLKKARGILESCELCPRRCRVNRLRHAKGFCRAGAKPAVYSWFAHPGEEPPISGKRGSGTIFFSHCTMKCVYCQNYKFSQLSGGKEISTRELADIMLALQKSGCHNINLVTPAHYAPQILEALFAAFLDGLNIPIVYNTSGYELVSTLRLMEGAVDIYLPDMRYGDAQSAKRFSDAPDYVTINRDAVKEMHRQVGDLVLDEEGIAKRGLIIRHLVLPNGLAASREIFKFISENLSNRTHISLMSQYHPVYRANKFTEINRRINKREYEEAFDMMLACGLANGWAQESSGRIDLRLLGTSIKKL